MITTRTPLRISLGGGGTDLRPFYENFGGHLITAAINKYIYVSVNIPSTCQTIKLYYDKVEMTDRVNDINHDIIRESLKELEIDYPLEIGSMADIEAGTGMGSSSSFTVGLVTALSVLKRNSINPEDIAKSACRVEITRAGKKIGIQDQYIATYGGIQEMNIFYNGRVEMKPLPLSREFITELENRIVLFYTGIRRHASTVLDKQTDDIKSRSNLCPMNHIKELSYRIKDALLHEDIDDFGYATLEHWNHKKKYDGMTNEEIDRWFELGMGFSQGGKVIGAGGGGFLMFICQPEKRKELIRKMNEYAGLKFMDFRFDFEGVNIITHI